MDNLGITILDGIFQKCIQAFFDPIKDLFNYFTASPEVIRGFAFVDILYDRLQVIGAAILILIVVFQSFKAKFAFLGFECEEPWRIGGRALAFGFLLGYAREITFIVLDQFKHFVDYLWGAMHLGAGAVQYRDLIVSILPMNIQLTLFSWNAIVFIYLCYKFIKLAFRFGERLMLTALLVMASPLAFAAGVSQTTKGFFQGWVKLFAGNLVVQLLQVTLFIAIVIYRATDPMLINMFSFIITVSLIKILEKLEDIVRDASINVGVGRDMSSGFQKVQSMIHTSTQTTQVINAAKVLLGR